MTALPRIVVTLGDVAGIGPEIVLKSWANPALFAQSQPVVIGDVNWLRKIQKDCGFSGRIDEYDPHRPWPKAGPEFLHCIQGTEQNLAKVTPGRAQTAAGQAAFDFLKRAIDMTMDGRADAIVTAPLHKEGLHAAGLHYPGHTEILAERTQTKRYAMMLYGAGIGVAHVTLHQSLHSIFGQITTANVLEKIELTNDVMTRLLHKTPRIGVCALNPHASDGGLFGNEEATIIEPAVRQAESKGIQVTGPWPSDTLFRRAKAGEFDGIVAMYHDQGHIALKLIAGFHLVNITLGLPIIRTSVAHGTAYDIVKKFSADSGSLLAAVDVACKLVNSQREGR
jgi:4-hydroxythreonine-4-phosphate dehydrogenase